MRHFFDTSVLISVFYGNHEHHEASMALFLRQKKRNGFTAAHCLAEVYSVLTGMPGKERVSPDEALLFLADVRERLTTVALEAEDYVGVLNAAAGNGIIGGGIYDALHARCALKAGADTIYTWNVKHFTRLGKEVAVRVSTPSRIPGASPADR